MFAQLLKGIAYERDRGSRLLQHCMHKISKTAMCMGMRDEVRVHAKKTESGRIIRILANPCGLRLIIHDVPCVRSTR